MLIELGVCTLKQDLDQCIFAKLDYHKRSTVKAEALIQQIRLLLQDSPF